MSLRLTPAIQEDLESAAARLGMAKQDVARLALQTGLQTLAKNGYDITGPIIAAGQAFEVGAAPENLESRDLQIELSLLMHNWPSVFGVFQQPALDRIEALHGEFQKRCRAEIEMRKSTRRAQTEAERQK